MINSDWIQPLLTELGLTHIYQVQFKLLHLNENRKESVHLLI